jgi:hypothetical protein
MQVAIARDRGVRAVPGIIAGLGTASVTGAAVAADLIRSARAACAALARWKINMVSLERE